jgi:hypothetical protein
MNKIIIFFYLFLLGFVKSEMKFEVENESNNNITFKNVYYQNNKNEQISFSLINTTDNCKCSTLKDKVKFTFVNNKLFFFVNLHSTYMHQGNTCYCMLKIDNHNTHFDFILFESSEQQRININYWKYLLNKSNKYDVIILAFVELSPFELLTKRLPLYLEIDKINKDIESDINFFF